MPVTRRRIGLAAVPIQHEVLYGGIRRRLVGAGETILVPLSVFNGREKQTEHLQRPQSCAA